MRVSRILPLIATMAVCLPSVSASFQVSVQKSLGQQAELADVYLDEKTVLEAKIAVDGPALVKYLRDRIPKDLDLKHLELLIQQLGDEKFVVREKAHKELLGLGPVALGAINRAAQHPDLEVRRRAAELRRRLQEEASPAVPAAIVRLVGFKKPEGAAEVLLAFLPMAADETVIEGIIIALSKVTVRAGKVEASVVAALADKLPLKRAAAGVTLTVAGAKENAEQVHGLLKDPAADVRLRVAQALIQTNHDKEAVPVLIHFLLELPTETSSPAEELLLRIAGVKAPRVSLGTDMASRKKCFEAWDAWWRENHKAIDLAQVDHKASRLGFTMVVYQEGAPLGGKANLPRYWVAEYDAANKVRWKFTVPKKCGAQVMGPNRVLVWELPTKRVTVRDFEGKIFWEKKYAANNNLVTAQYLPNGNIFVAKRNWFYEYDLKGKEVFSYNRANLGVYHALKLRDGDIVYITANGSVNLLDAKNKKEIPKFAIAASTDTDGSITELANGNLLLAVVGNKWLAVVGNNRAIEYDRDGKEVWSLPYRFPTSAQRLPNGNTLVTLQETRRVVEFDRAGREVWACPVEGIVHMAQRR